MAEEEGFGDTADDHHLSDSPLADYGVDGIDDERLSTGASGVVGVLLTFGVGVGVFATVRALRPRDGADGHAVPGVGPDSSRTTV